MSILRHGLYHSLRSSVVFGLWLPVGIGMNDIVYHNFTVTCRLLPAYLFAIRCQTLFATYIGLLIMHVSCQHERLHIVERHLNGESN